MFSPSFGENRDFRCTTQPGRSHRCSSDLGRAAWAVCLLKSFSQQCNITLPSLSVIPVCSMDQACTVHGSQREGKLWGSHYGAEWAVGRNSHSWRNCGTRGHGEVRSSSKARLLLQLGKLPRHQG